MQKRPLKFDDESRQRIGSESAVHGDQDIRETRVKNVKGPVNGSLQCFVLLNTAAGRGKMKLTKDMLGDDALSQDR